MRFPGIVSAALLLGAAILSGCVANSGDDFAAAESAMNKPVAEEGSTAGETAAASSEVTESDTAAAAPTPSAKPATTLTPGQAVKLNPVAKIAPTAVAAVAPRPGSAVYRCGSRGSMQIDNRRSSVTLLDPDGQAMMLPASPAGQISRYGQKPYALILEGGEALYVKPGKPPFTCKR